VNSKMSPSLSSVFPWRAYLQCEKDLAIVHNMKRATQKVARFHLSRSLRPQPPTDHIHQITTVTQRYGEQF
jgi:hypothetical protein